MNKVNAGIAILMISLIVGSCGTWSNLGKGTAIGAGAGAAVGAVVGAIAGKDVKGAAIGAAIGGVVGAGAGAIVGSKMDKQKAELEALENAKVEEITDANNLKGLKVTFDNAILFATNSSTLSAASKSNLEKFAQTLKNTADTDVTIFGHTDNTGTYDVNQRISNERAKAVSDFLIGAGIQPSRLSTVGKAYDDPIADNNTVDGRAQNRRVEIYITANEKMIQEAQTGI
jgi:Outer membrane protein and related peptidoglycan-associated (lipo)proteins